MSTEEAAAAATNVLEIYLSPTATQSSSADNTTTQEDASQSPSTRTALVAIGSMVDAHDAVLAAAGTKHPPFPHPIAPLKEFYDQVRANGGQYPGRPAWQPPPHHHAHLFSCLAGTWRATGLLNERNTLCGAVLWHSDSLLLASNTRKQTAVVTTTRTELQLLAQDLRETICLQGAAGAYNANEEPASFLQLGGRIVGRMTWEAGQEGPNSRALPELDPLKFRYEAIDERLEDGGWGPDFSFFPVDTYLDTTWPILKKLGYGFDDFDDDDDDPSCEEPEDEPDEPYLRRYGQGFYLFLRNQEYMAARILLDTSVPEEMGTVVRCILLFTYECPEQIGDALLEGGISLSGQASDILTSSSFWEYVSQESITVAELRGKLSLLSAFKLFALTKELLARQQRDDTTAIGKLLTALYQQSSSTTTVYAPSLRLLHNEVFVSCAPAAVDTIVSTLHECGRLVEMVTTVEDYYNKDSNANYYPHSGELLKTIQTVECAQYLLDAGAHTQDYIQAIR